MLSTKVKYLIISVLATIMLISVTSPVVEAAEVDDKGNTEAAEVGTRSDGLTYQGGNSLTGGHTYSDLYSSYIFSKSKSDVASEVNGNLNELSKYPTDSEDTGTGENDNQAYGQMTGPFSQRDSQQKDVGKQTATYINTLYKYDYVVPAPRNSDEKSVLSIFGNLIAGNNSSLNRTADSYLTKKSLDTASMGASVFDFFSAATDKFSTLARNLDVTRILYNTDKNLSDGNEGNGFIESTVIKTLELLFSKTSHLEEEKTLKYALTHVFASNFSVQ